jgi:hypothetical protein
MFSEQNITETPRNVDVHTALYLNCRQNHQEVTTQFLKTKTGLCFDDEHPTRREDCSHLPFSQGGLSERKNMGRELLMF